MKKLLFIILTFASLSVFGQAGSLSQSVYRSRVNDSTTVNGSHSAGYGDFFWNAQASTPGWRVWNGTSYDIGFSSGGSNTSSALTDASTITITGLKHTLTSDEATITWTLSHTSDFQTTDIILNATSTTWTFPANALCVVDGVASGTNTAALTGVIGDHHIMSIYKDGTNYRVVIKNFGQ